MDTLPGNASPSYIYWAYSPQHLALLTTALRFTHHNFTLQQLHFQHQHLHFQIAHGVMYYIHQTLLLLSYRGSGQRLSLNKQNVLWQTNWHYNQAIITIAKLEDSHQSQYLICNYSVTLYKQNLFHPHSIVRKNVRNPIT